MNVVKSFLCLHRLNMFVYYIVLRSTISGCRCSWGLQLSLRWLGVLGGCQVMENNTALTPEPELNPVFLDQTLLIAVLLNWYTRRSRLPKIVVLRGFLSFVSLRLYLTVSNQPDIPFDAIDVILLTCLILSIHRDATIEWSQIHSLCHQLPAIQFEHSISS